MTARPRSTAGMNTADGRQSPVASRGVLPRRGEVSEGVAAVLGLPAASQRPSKYRNAPVEVDGIRFDSKAEAARYGELVRAQQAGAIRSLEVHPRFPLVIHGIDTGDYVADFSYVTADGVAVVEDVKSAPTRKLPTYRLKRKMMWALYAIEIREV